MEENSNKKSYPEKDEADIFREKICGLYTQKKSSPKYSFGYY